MGPPLTRENSAAVPLPVLNFSTVAIVLRLETASREQPISEPGINPHTQTWRNRHNPRGV